MTATFDYEQFFEYSFWKFLLNILNMKIVFVLPLQARFRFVIAVVVLVIFVIAIIAAYVVIVVVVVFASAADKI